MGAAPPPQPPDARQYPFPFNMLVPLLTWVTGTFGPTETILIIIGGVFLSVTMGWVSSPMMKTLSAIHDEQLTRKAALDDLLVQKAAETQLLRKICVHDSANDQERAECWK